MCNDCLFMIFDYLKLDDLIAVAQTCSTLKKVAYSIFSRRYDNSIAETSHRGSKIAKLELIRNVLMAFGDEMSTLEASSIDGWYSEKPNDHRIFTLLKKYFCGNIDDDDTASEGFKKELQLKEFHFDEYTVENVNFVFARLSKLELTKCKLLDGTEQLFANCVNLTKLKLDFVHTNPAVVFSYVGRANGRRFNKYKTNVETDPCFNHSFPNLTSFSMKSITTATADDLENFLSKNPQLKKLKIVNCRQFDGLLQSLIDHVPNIEKLNVHSKYIKKKELVQLVKLRKLVIQEVNSDNICGALKGVAKSKMVLDTLKLVGLLPTEKIINSVSAIQTLTKWEWFRN